MHSVLVVFQYSIWVPIYHTWILHLEIMSYLVTFKTGNKIKTRENAQAGYTVHQDSDQGQPGLHIYLKWM